MENQTVDILVRDLTKVGSIPKSEARRRILELLSSQKQRVMEVLEGMEKNQGQIEPHQDLRELHPYQVADSYYNQALSDIKNKIKEEL